MKESDKKSVALLRIELLIVKVDGHMRKFAWKRQIYAKYKSLSTHVECHFANEKL